VSVPGCNGDLFESGELNAPRWFLSVAGGGSSCSGKADIRRGGADIRRGRADIRHGRAGIGRVRADIPGVAGAKTWQQCWLMRGGRQCGR